MVTGSGASRRAKRAYVLFLFFGAFALLAIVTMANQTLRELNSGQQLERALNKAHDRREQLQDVFSLLQDGETGLRGFLLTRNPVFLAPYQNAEDRLDSEWSQLKQLFARDPARLERLEILVRTKRDLLRAGAERATNLPAAERHDRALSGKVAMDRIRDEIALLNQQEAAMLEQLRTHHQHQALSTRRAVIVLSVLFVLLMLGAAITIWHYMRRQAGLLKEVAASDSQQQALFQGSFQPLLVLEDNGNVVRINFAAEKAIQQTSKEVVGKNVRLFVDLDRSGDPRILDQLRNKRSPLEEALEGEICVRRKDGSVFPAEVSVSPVTIDNTTNIIVALKDVSERRRMDEMKSQFVSTVSHELRTPLTSIAGSLGLLAGGAAGVLPDKAARLIGIAQSNSQRLVRLINDILDIEKLESGQMALRLERVDLRELAMRSIDAVSGMASDHKVQVELDGRATATVMGDMDRLIQVIVNLLSNALKFSPSGETVTVRLMVDDGPTVTLTVLDRGPGVPEAFRSRIFEKFAQADSSDTRQRGGTGLGLAISREIAERHGGRLWFDPDPGHGAVFHLQLPRVAAVPIQNRVDGPQLLVVEDDPDAAEVLRSILQEDGYQVQVASTAREALALVGQTKFAAALIDLQLPDANGVSLIRALRKSALTRDLPILVVSADISQGMAKAASLQVLDWMEKPLEVDRLLHAVQAGTAGSKAQPLILHVEDEEDVRSLTASALSGVATIEAAGSLAEARRYLESRHPDLVILDIGLPDGSGLELLGNLESGDQPPIPAIIYSASDADLELGAGIEAVLVKSRTSVSSLARTVRRLTRKDMT